MYWHLGYGEWWMGLIMILFWVAIIALVVWGIRTFARPGTAEPTPSRARPLDILETRYARGEIDDEEFERRRKMLEHSA